MIHSFLKGFKPFLARGRLAIIVLRNEEGAKSRGHPLDRNRNPLTVDLNLMGGFHSLTSSKDSSDLGEVPLTA